MHEQALTPESAELFPQFSTFEKFYLAGGTALALHIGHRLSVDLDFFSSDALPANLLARVKKTIKTDSFSVSFQSPEQLDCIINGVRVTFLFYPYPPRDEFAHHNKIPVVTIGEIAAMKALSIGRRLSYKDYVDWYFFLKEKHVQLDEVIERATEKFSTDFNDRLFLGQLVSFSDIPDQKIAFLRDAVNRETIQEFLEKTVRNFQL